MRFVSTVLIGLPNILIDSPKLSKYIEKGKSEVTEVDLLRFVVRSYREKYWNGIDLILMRL